MATKEAKVLSFQVVHGTSKFDVRLELPPEEAGDTLCVKHLMDEVYRRTDIPPDAQRLIYKGRSLKDGDEELNKVGIKKGVKVMLIGKKPSPVDDENTREMKSVEETYEKEAKKLGDITYELDGIHRGYLDKEKRSDATKALEKRLASVAESLMRLLEKLDALRFEETNKGARGKRKSLVDKIQVLLNRVDGLSRGPSPDAKLSNS
ncbi:BAG family molecular chaperone regulator 1-like isoform X2 [Mya arenaria]|uniref:BAG family molecular chaperone regulator 1-like isoform X2 n=1 Tax=Mya arenaria TaxID=6604 RepID=UPI0022E49208|nr:BAG family molecular chaperone regulator 1-like isoform X2 [Mya arenaria]